MLVISLEVGIALMRYELTTGVNDKIWSIGDYNP